MSTSVDLRNLSDLWLRRYRPCAAPAVRLVCFPHAGGSASSFLPFVRELPDEVEVLAVQYPGRQDRRAEPLIDNVESLVGPLADVLGAQSDRPLVLFGHSMGATVAYEVARVLERRGTGPAALVVSGRRAPTTSRRTAVHLYDDERLIAELRSLDGTDQSLLTDPELLELVLPAIRNDYRAVGHYVHRPGAPLACPLTVLTGVDDPDVTVEEAAAWRDVAARAHVRTFPGGHFFLYQRTAEVCAAIVSALAPLLPDDSTRGTRPLAPGAVANADYADRRRTAERVRASADALDSRVTPMAGVPGWLAEYGRAHHFHAEPIPFERLQHWHFEPGTGNLRHESGRFFSIEGLRSSSDTAPADRVCPIIVQPEVGLLGILAREFDGVLHFLVQAKPEPGNVNGLQLSPTVQATRSNFDEVHHGRPTPFLDHFIHRPGRRVLADTIQSEQGDWFLHKRNRNMVVEVAADVAADDSFRWLTLGQIRRLMMDDDLVNMDTRSVLACLPTAHAEPGDDAGDDGWPAALRRSFYGNGAPLHDLHAITSCLTDVQALRVLRQQSVPLNRAYEDGWHRTPTTIGHESGRGFEVMAVDVTAEQREVASWTQPLLRPCSQGLVALIARRINGVLHALVAARSDIGTLNVAEFGPTVQLRSPEPPDEASPYLDYVRAAGPDRIRYDVVQSEEGGRFYHARNRYLVIEAGSEIPVHCPPGFRWASFGQLTELLAHGNYLNVELRTLITCAHASY
ncbi:alpha/beta fold hydrolase [Streptomyces sp. NPDC088116]|uniref:alpha/beta fold hydrolase n=1 Tax=Streptomyces sp. NPDC088116 TaxID=3365825 RepID=UPI003812AEFD